MKTLSFTINNFANIIEAFNDQKKVAIWVGVPTIIKRNLLERAGKVANIIDVLVRYNNKHNEVKINDSIHLESIRLGMYEDLAKVVLNEISHKTNKMFPQLAKLRKELAAKELSNMNLSVDSSVIFIAKLGDILNSYFEAKSEFKLGSRNENIIFAIENAQNRLEAAKSICDDSLLADTMVKISTYLMNANPDECDFASTIDLFSRQSQIKRWSRRETLNQFNLLEHSARVTCLVDVFLQVFKSELKINDSEALQITRYALYHDYPEVILNDTPSPVKRLYPELDSMLKEIEAEIMTNLELDETKKTKFICKIVDIFDCRYEAQQEILLGNNENEFKIVLQEYANNFNSQVKKYSGVSSKIVNRLMKLYK